MRKGETFLFSAGGYHPEFAVPPGFPRLQRVKISLADSKHLKLLLTGYVAITSNTRQIGARMEFFAGFGDFSIEAVLGFDALWEPDVRFLIDFDLEFKLKYKGITFFGVDVSGRFSGPEPKRVKGEWSIDLWLTSISKKFDKTFGADRPPAVLPPVDPLPELVAALKDPLSWTAEPPGVHARVLPQARGAVRAPAGPARRAPAGAPARRSGSTASAAASWRARSATTSPRRPSAGARSTSRPPLSEAFAAAEYLNLSDDEKLARPSFDFMPAGVSLSPTGVTFGPAVDSQLSYDDKIFGAAGGPPVSKPPADPVAAPARAGGGGVRRAGALAAARPLRRRRPGPAGRRRALRARAHRGPRGRRSRHELLHRRAAGRPARAAGRLPRGGHVVSAGYQFLPWVRSGAAAGYTLPDSLKPVLAATARQVADRDAGDAEGQRAPAVRGAGAALRPRRRDRDRRPDA